MWGFVAIASAALRTEASQCVRVEEGRLFPGELHRKSNLVSVPMPEVKKNIEKTMCSLYRGLLDSKFRNLCIA